MRDVRVAALVVQLRRPRNHRFFRIEHRAQLFVDHVEFAAAFFGGAFGFGDDCRNTLAYEARDVVEHIRVVGIDAVIFVDCRRIEAARNVFPRVDGHDAGHGHRLCAIDGNDLRVRVRRAQHFEMQRAFGQRNVRRILRAPRDDLFRERIAHAGSARFSRAVDFDVGLSVERIADRAVPGATAEIAFERMR